METQELIMTALRALGVYVLVLVVIRITGKRTIGHFTAFDLLVALMLGEVVDEIIYGDVTIAQGAVAIIVIALAEYGNSWLTYWDHGFDALLEGKPTVIVEDGKLVRRGMRRERINEKDVMAELRVQGIDDIREVKRAIVENDGEVSVIKQEWAEPVQKADLGGEMAKQKKARDQEG
ncbi:MAG TPA: YetF domain-containing protein [Blastocatellia bacterium]|nr:YetF domain-containing protein [Blastocatellia bacterium]